MQGTDREPLATRLTGLAFVMAVVGAFCWLIWQDFTKPASPAADNFASAYIRGTRIAKLDLNAGKLVLYRGNLSKSEKHVIQLLEDRYGIQVRISNDDTITPF